MGQFVHLHVHSSSSQGESVAPLKGIIAKAKKAGMPGIAITDIGQMSSAFQATKQAGEDFKVVLGCELYTSAAPEQYTQVFLAKNYKGYNNLCKLSSIGYAKGLAQSPQPWVDFTQVERHAKGLICLTGWKKGIVPQLIREGKSAEAEEIVQQYHALFGEDFYLSVQRHGEAQDDAVNQTLLGWAEKYGISLVAAHEVCSIEKQDSEALAMLQCQQEGKPLSAYKEHLDEGKYAFRSAEEMQETFADWPGALDSTMEILEKCSTPYLDQDPLWIPFKAPRQFETEDAYLRHLAFEGAELRYDKIAGIVNKRLQNELRHIEMMRCARYFLIWHDIVKHLRDEGVLLSPGRGSTSGGLICYCLGITDIDPVEHDLYGERFMNPSRPEVPRIDIELEEGAAEIAYRYFAAKYPLNQTAYGILPHRISTTEAVDMAAEALALTAEDKEAIDAFIKNYPSLERAAKTDKTFNGLPEEHVQRKAVQAALALEGAASGFSANPSTIVIAPNDLTGYIPLCHTADSSTPISQFSDIFIEEAGLLKLDFFELSPLSTLGQLVRASNEGESKGIDLNNIPLDDTDTLALFQKGDTAGIYSFDNPDMQALLAELKPTSFDALLDVFSLFHANDAGKLEAYKQMDKGQTYAHPLLEEVLAPTHGVLLYQEQLIALANKIGDMTYGKADLLRRAFSKNKPKKMASYEAIFFNGAIRLGDMSEQTARDTIELMKQAAGTCYSRAHAVAHTTISFQMAYAKAHFPEVFEKIGGA